MPQLFLGLDLGGTNVKAGIVDAHGKLLGQVSVKTEAEHGDPHRVIANMVRGARQVLAATHLSLDHIAAIGVASPGPLSTVEGIVIRSANLPNWVNVPLRRQISLALQKPTLLENDANAAAYGEYWAGAGKGGKIQDLVMLTLGTGVGGGIINDGKVVHGKWDFAAEIGHTIVVLDGEPCGCGQRGCLETYCSAFRTGKRATDKLLASAQPSSLRPLLEKHGAVTAADVALHAQKSDPFALAIWDETCKFIALACVNAVHFMDPEIIVLAGGMSQAGDFLIHTVRQHFAALYWKMAPATVQVKLAELANDAGVIGAAGVAAEAWARQAVPPIGA